MKQWTAWVASSFVQRGGWGGGDKREKQQSEYVVNDRTHSEFNLYRQAEPDSPFALGSRRRTVYLTFALPSAKEESINADA